MIRNGDNPENDPTTVKFLATTPGGLTEGLRGILLATSHGGSEGVVLAVNGTFDRETVVWGRLYRVRETDPNEYARLVERVTEVPNDKAWRIALPVGGPLGVTA